MLDEVKMKINIKGLLLFDVVYSICFPKLISIIGLPPAIKYIPDFVNIFLLFYLLSSSKKLKKLKLFYPVIALLVGLIIVSGISFIINKYSVLLLLGGIRQYAKIAIMAISAITVFDKSDYKRINSILYFLFILNFIDCLFQFFVLGWKGDYLGGLFSYGMQGGNGPLTVFLIIIATVSVKSYILKKMSFKKMICILLMYVLISAMAELKLAFLLIFACVIYLFVTNRKVKRATVLLLTSIATIAAGLAILFLVFPNTKDFYTLDGMVDYVAGDSHGYASKDDLSRTRAIEQIDTMFFHDDLAKKIFGFGLGNCSKGPTDALTSDFYVQYGDVLHHTWILFPFVYLELGLAGVVLLIGIFTAVIIRSLKNCLAKDDNRDEMADVYLFLAFVMMLMIWYNDFLYSEQSYFAYIVICYPFIRNKIRINGSTSQ